MNEDVIGIETGSISNKSFPSRGQSDATNSHFNITSVGAANGFLQLWRIYCFLIEDCVVKGFICCVAAEQIIENSISVEMLEPSAGEDHGRHEIREEVGLEIWISVLHDRRWC